MSATTLAEFEAPKIITGIFGTVEITYHPANDLTDIDGNVYGRSEPGYIARVLDGIYERRSKFSRGLRRQALMALYHDSDLQALAELEAADIQI